MSRAETRAQRTLVKSPPELWAEVSDVDALARHLGRFGDIRITRLEPETTVVWEGDRARGTVELAASGWGTKVTLTAEVAEGAAGQAPVEDLPEEPRARETAGTGVDGGIPRGIAVGAGAADQAPGAPTASAPPVSTGGAVERDAPVAAGEPALPPEPVTPPVAAAEPEPEPEPTPAAVRAAARAAAREAAAAPEPAEPPRRGLFARLFGFGRKPKPQPAAEPSSAEESRAEEPQAAAPAGAPEPVAPEPVVVPEPVAAEPEPVAEPEPIAEPEPVAVEPEPGPAAAPAPAPLDHETAVAVLTGVLDDLGAAHHRPFSRQ